MPTSVQFADYNNVEIQNSILKLKKKDNLSFIFPLNFEAHTLAFHVHDGTPDGLVRCAPFIFLSALSA